MPKYLKVPSILMLVLLSHSISRAIPCAQITVVPDLPPEHRIRTLVPQKASKMSFEQMFVDWNIHDLLEVKIQVSKNHEPKLVNLEGWLPRMTAEELTWLKQQSDAQHRQQYLEFFYPALAGKTVAVLYSKAHSQDTGLYLAVGEILTVINTHVMDPESGFPDYRTTVFYFLQDAPNGKQPARKAVVKTPRPINILEVRIRP